MQRKYEFYHGTSSLFIESILKNGLGGINPNLKFKNLELLKFIYGQCENILFNEEKYNLLMRETTLAMIRQTDLLVKRENQKEVALNYRHENIYVSLSEIKALTYSVTNRIGSEILQRSYDLYQLLLKNNVYINIPEDLNYYGIEKIEIEKIRPLLIKTKRVEKNNIIQENGYDGEEFIEFLNEHFDKMTEKDKFFNFQYMNFGLKKSIEIERCEVYEIEFSGSIEERNFEYKLIEYKNV
ncbi:MAG: hypothetical protein COA32_12170 [Fluviicola sp.]|nr:MAG: hypothetical protein COA32_12170 [Fluviicola sp.]